MSADIRDRLREAASQPSSPLDTTAIYQRGRQARQLRVAGLAAASVLGIAAATGVVMAISGPANVPVIEPVGLQDELLADGWISWHEYRIAAAAVSDCLQDRGVDPAYDFDEESGRFTFDASGTPDFDACASAHLERVETAWWEKVGPEADGVTWPQYRAAVRESVDCINGNGGDARAEFSIDSGAYGLTVPVGVEIDDCRASSRAGLLESQWAVKAGPSAAEDRAFYESVVRCLRDLGHDVPNADASTLADAAESLPADYFGCFEEVAQPWASEQAEDFAALSPGAARQLAEAIAGSGVEDVPDLAGPDAVQVDAVEDGQIAEPSSHVWFTLRVCDDGSQVVDQVWVRDEQGDVHGAAISFEC